MIRAFFLSLLMLVSGFSLAQQDPLFTQYMYNKLTFNPAFAGSEEGICANSATRNQWVDFPGGPFTTSLFVHAPIKKINSGIGLTTMYDAVGMEKNFISKIAYSYHLNLPVGKLNFGMETGIITKKIENNFVSTGSVSQDSSLPNSGFSGTVADFSVGTYYHNDKMYAGFSTTHILQPSFSFGYQMKRHYYLTGGYTIGISEEFAIQPSVLIKTEGSSIQTDLNTNIQYFGFISGVTVRPGSSVSHLIGYGYKNFRFVYSYDLMTNGLRRFAGITHELTLKYCLSLPNWLQK